MRLRDFLHINRAGELVETAKDRVTKRWTQESRRENL